MGKSMVPRGATIKVKCKCGRFYFPYAKNNGEIIEKCELCYPRPMEKEK
jgi:hypothetical protein